MARLTASTPLEADVTIPATMYDPELVLFADGTQVVMRAKGVERFGVTIGRSAADHPYPFQAVKWEDGTTDHVAPHVLHRVTTEDLVLAALTAKPGATYEETTALVNIHMPDVTRDAVVSALADLFATDLVRVEVQAWVKRFHRI